MVIFLQTEEELYKFFTRKLKYDVKNRAELPEVGKQGIALIASPQKGIHVLLENIECICSPDNPHYDKRMASAKAHELMLSPDAIPYEPSCILQELNLLPDACLNSTKGEEHGRKFLHHNANFLTDYFYHKNWTKDFNDPELCKWTNKQKENNILL